MPVTRTERAQRRDPGRQLVAEPEGVVEEIGFGAGRGWPAADPARTARPRSAPATMTAIAAASHSPAMGHGNSVPASAGGARYATASETSVTPMIASAIPTPSRIRRATAGSRTGSRCRRLRIHVAPATRAIAMTA